MVSVVKRTRSGRDYYYLYHDSKKGKRRQREAYLGRTIPDDVGERKKIFATKIEMDEWLPLMEAIRRGYAREMRGIPKPIREKNIRDFSVRFTYNTQRIEGSTLTLRDTALFLEDGITPSNRPAGDLMEAEAHQRVFLGIIKERNDLTLRAVKRWNRELLAYTKPGIAGLLRSYDVRIGRSRFIPPPHAAVGALTKGFFRWYNVRKKRSNPAELAALVHLKFATIHPFGDGNGRTSRLMMNFVLNRHGYPMLDIGYGDRRSYYTALERSQTGDDELPFLRWFMKRYAKAHQRLL